MEHVIANQYKVIKKIGAGSFGEIYAVEDIRTHKHYAVKTESKRTNCPQLLYEAKLYGILQGSANVPSIQYVGTEATKNVMVMDLLGKSLEDIFVMCHRRFSIKTVLMLADQMLSAVEYVHKHHYIHRDLKPDNFVVGTGQNSNKIFLIDFGLAKRYMDDNTLEHIPYSENKSLSGTARYASINALRGIEQSRRDDLEALGYVWVYFLRGSLPWMGLQANGSTQKYRRICEVKMQTPVEVLCKGFPLEFIQYFYYVRRLQFSDTPDYSHLRTMMRNAFQRLGYFYDYQYDWKGMKTETMFFQRKDILVKRATKKKSPYEIQAIETKRFVSRKEAINRDPIRKEPNQRKQEQESTDRLYTARKRMESEKPKHTRTPQLLTPSVRQQMMGIRIENVREDSTKPSLESKIIRVTTKRCNDISRPSRIYRF